MLKLTLRTFSLLTLTAMLSSCVVADEQQMTEAEAIEETEEAVTPPGGKCTIGLSWCQDVDYWKVRASYSWSSSKGQCKQSIEKRKYTKIYHCKSSICSYSRTQDHGHWVESSSSYNTMTKPQCKGTKDMGTATTGS